MATRKRWSREETLVALHVYLQLTFGQLHARHPLIRRVANWIGRQPDAVAMKLCNIASLDRDITSTGRKGLDGASALDRQIWSEFESDPIRMTREAELQFEALAKQQDESPAIDVIDELPELFEGKTRLATVPIRIHQARFRRQVLASYDAACCICGLSDPRLLIASHIVPWSQDQANRLNPSNGLCLSALHDKAYDAGLITVLPDYTIRVSRALLKKPSDAFLTATLASYDGTKIRLPRRFRPTPELLEKHARRFDFLR